jgi:hypothetical protein
MYAVHVYDNEMMMMMMMMMMMRVRIWLEDAGCDKNAQLHYSDDDGDLSNG